MPDWADQEQSEKPKRFRDLTAAIDSGTVRQARTGQKTKRKQVSQTIHFNEAVADDAKTAVDRCSALSARGPPRRYSSVCPGRDSGSLGWVLPEMVRGTSFAADRTP